MLSKIEEFIKYAEKNNIDSSSLTEFERWRTAEEEIEEFTYTRKEALEKIAQDLYDYYMEEPGEAVDELVKILIAGSEKYFTPYEKMTDEELVEEMTSMYPGNVKINIIPRKTE